MKVKLESKWSMASAANFDLVILGSGSTAFAAALRAQELGKTAVMAVADYLKRRALT